MANSRKAEQIRLANVVHMYRAYDPEHRIFTRLRKETDGAGELLIVGKMATYTWKGIVNG